MKRKSCKITTDLHQVWPPKKMGPIFYNPCCWWNKFSSGWYGKYFTIYRASYIPGWLARFLPSTVVNRRLQSPSATSPASPFPLFLSTLWPRHWPPFFRQWWATRLKLADFFVLPKNLLFEMFSFEIACWNQTLTTCLASKWWQRLPGKNYPMISPPKNPDTSLE